MPWNVPTHRALARHAQQLLDSAAHLAGRLVGERDCQDAAGCALAWMSQAMRA